MAEWQFLGADETGIKVRLLHENEYVDVTLPPTRDYFEEDGKVSAYITQNFTNLWGARHHLGAAHLQVRIDSLETTLSPEVTKLRQELEATQDILILNNVMTEAEKTIIKDPVDEPIIKG